MEQLLGLLQALATSTSNKEEKIDMLKDEPGYAEFVEASDQEYDHRNFKEARRLYEKASAMGHPMAQFNFALWFLEGNRPGAKKNLKRAFDLFQESSKKKLGMALFNLADFYSKGKGGVVKQDYERAYSLVREAIKDPRVDQKRQGSPYMMLGMMCFKGEGCMKSYKKAMKYFQKAHEFGHPGADPKMLRMMNLLCQIDPMEQQKMTDRKWDRMTAWLDEHPEEKAETMADHLHIMNKFGFQIERTLTEEQKNTKGGFDKFMEMVGGAFTHMEEYEMEDEPVPPAKCSKCDRPGAMRKCGKCGEHYCNRVCQKADWRDHKRICQAIQASM